MASTNVVERAALASPDRKTVALVFGTFDFLELQINWVCHALALGIRWFALVAMDARLHAALLSIPTLRDHVLLLPRARDHNLNITKMNVIGERQRFGLTVLEKGFNVVHSDSDAYWVKDPWPLLSTDDDVVAERIWGKPLSVVKAWGAAICTGFYFLRSSPRTIALARTTRDAIAKKRAQQPTWQASDQYCLNVALHRKYALRWDGNATMLPQSSMETKFHDKSAHRGTATTPQGPLRVAMLAHALVPRACPVLSAAELKSAQGKGARGKPAKLRGKAYWWQELLRSAVVVHCFPPGSDPPPGERRFIFMGHPKHTDAEMRFARRQNLWRVRELAIRSREEICTSAAT